MKKTIYSLAPLRELLLAANRRYLEFIATIEDDKAGADKLNKISQPAAENDRNYRGLTSSIRGMKNCLKRSAAASSTSAASKIKTCAGA